jgi:hypothetical protein
VVRHLDLGGRRILLGLDGAQFILESFQILDEPGGQSLHGELLLLSGELVNLEAEPREGARLETDQQTFVESRLASRHRRRGVEAVQWALRGRTVYGRRRLATAVPLAERDAEPLAGCRRPWKQGSWRGVDLGRA